MVGSEAEFNELNRIQRKALADSVGVNVEELSRLVRNQGTGQIAAASSASEKAAKKTDRMLDLTANIDVNMAKTAKGTAVTADNTGGGN